MNKTSYLGELEYMILLTVLRLGDEAYGRSIREELESQVGRKVSRSVAYITLERMFEKGYLTPSMGNPSPQRGGKAKRYYTLTPAGIEMLRESGRAFKQLWVGHESLLEEA
jgi:DNA-binding PadR family transcriptional regulator